MPNTTRPKVSVVIPVYNAATTLVECLDSIRAQSFSQFEVLIVDDGSTDQSPSIAEDWEKKDSRFKLFRQSHTGIVKALNIGFEHAKSTLVARMDADDRMHPHRLQLQFTHMDQNPDIDLLACRVRLFSSDPISNGLQKYIDWQNLCTTREQIRANLFNEAPFAHPSVMIRRQCVRDIGGYIEGPFPEDYELWLRLHQRAAIMEKLSHVLLQWRDNSQRLSRTDPRYSRQAFDKVRANYLLTSQMVPGHRPLAIWGAGRRTRRRAELFLRRFHPPQVWIDIDPHKIGKRYMDAKVVSPNWLSRTTRPFVLCYVNNHGAQHKIKIALKQMGYQELRDYLIVG